MSSLTTPGVIALVLITRLGSTDYHERERAMKTLSQISPLILPYLEAAKRHPDLEVARRSNMILTSYYHQAADHLLKKASPTQWPRLPWIDMLPKDHPNRAAVISHFLDQARKQIGRKGPPDWDDYRLATRLYIHRLFLNQQKLDEVRQLLDEMAVKEEHWIINNGKNYSPPLQLPQAAGK